METKQFNIFSLLFKILGRQFFNTEMLNFQEYTLTHIVTFLVWQRAPDCGNATPPSTVLTLPTVIHDSYPNVCAEQKSS